MVKIMSYGELIQELKPLKEKSEEIAVILITDPGVQPNKIIEEKAELIHLEFMDNSVTKDQVQQAIEFSEENENVIVCCGGLSNSSALAYSIECTEVNPAMAVNLWDKNKHKPNPKIIQFASEILKNPKIESYYRKWLN